MLALEGEHPRFGRSVAIGLQGLIILSVLCIGIETLPGLPSWAVTLLGVTETWIVLVFTAEYLLRVFAAERPLGYVTSFWGVIDLLAIMPFYLGLGSGLQAARAFRLLRLFRILKLARYSRAADRIRQALRSVLEELVVFGCAALVLLYLCSIVIYYFEHEAQPEAFASVFHSMWWTAITLTTVGYGDVYPITGGGRVFTVVMLLLALGIIAVPTGLVASALSKLREKGGEDGRSASSQPLAHPERPEP